MSNNIWENNEGEEETFQDIPEEVNGNVSEIPVVKSATHSPKRPAPTPRLAKSAPIKKNEAPIQEPEIADEEEEDFKAVLSDARLRLEQGRLYEMIMNHDFFAGVDADSRAIKHVQKEIRNFAKESMEIMLGMRQTKAVHAAELSSFNGLEVEVLKALASTATGGNTKKVEEKRSGLNPIGTKQSTTNKPPLSKNQSAIKRAAKNGLTEEQIEQILEEEGVTREEYESFYRNHRPLDKSPDKLSTDELLERNSNVTAGKQVKSSTAIPMPSPEQIEGMYAARTNKASANPQMQMILSLVEQSRNKK